MRIRNALLPAAVIAALAGLLLAATITPQARQTIDKGLDWLSSAQNQDGSWDAGDRGGTTACAALAGLAFMSDGSLPGRGEYGENVSRALDYILRSRQPSGLLEYGAPHHAMYAHGYSTLFLAETLGEVTDERIRPALLRAVDLIVRTQNRRGGWRYQPRVADADISVTICQLVALRAAANAGVTVPRETVDRAVGYIRSCALPGGGFSYQAGSGEPAFARTAGALFCLLVAGERDLPEVERAADYLLRASGRDDRFYFYGHYYAAQAMNILGGSRWREWYAEEADAFRRSQRYDGSWISTGEERPQCTAMAVMALTVPNGYLPIYQR